MWLLGKMKLYVIVGAAALASAFLWGEWNRFDAVQDYKVKVRLATAEGRLDNITEDRERDKIIDGLDDNGLMRTGAKWLFESGAGN